MLVRQGPATIALDASYFYQYTGGVFTGCANKTISVNHAVVVVGFTANGDWIIKNSWGEDWGDNGYIIISKDANCGFTDLAEIEVKDFYEETIE